MHGCVFSSVLILKRTLAVGESKAYVTVGVERRLAFSMPMSDKHRDRELTCQARLLHIATKADHAKTYFLKSLY